MLVHNVSTCAAVHKAIRLGQPLVERIVTLNGGAIAMGHPLGATGAMILGTLLDELDARQLPWGIVTNKAMRFAGPVIEALSRAVKAGHDVVAAQVVAPGAAQVQAALRDGEKFSPICTGVAAPRLVAGAIAATWLA